MKLILKYAAILVLFIICTCAHAQKYKAEKEVRIKAKELPASILDQADQIINDAKKVKYYFESDSGRTSYEIKLKKDHILYSIEFNKNGMLEDIERLVCFMALPDNVIQNVADHLAKYANYQIRKSQKQYSDPSASLQQIFYSAHANESRFTIRYELIISVLQNNSWQGYEMLFDEQGKFLEQREIVGRADDHILY
ncbi:hypothetical protein [Fulvivirga ligni]|uniref:hypothetical protein n=1 Tax=Fulvivirga ligni TaxID=2904246 RepID=UPI001F34CE1B|nr:hypothetical protein [Fulvivirga ligni]UII22244.1 hypothetical protein LVD16_03240 [Fulvivirga ligni]